MIKHIVMFKMKVFNYDEELVTNIALINDRLKALPSLIKEIVSFEIGVNESGSPGAYDMVLVSEFYSYDDLKKYQIHPEHVSVINVIKELTEKTIVVDYKLN